MVDKMQEHHLEHMGKAEDIMEALLLSPHLICQQMHYITI